jgi:hypothetical protein
MTTVIKKVLDERGPTPTTADWEVESLVVSDLKPEDLNRDVVFVDLNIKPKAPRVGTLCAYSESSEMVWIKFTPSNQGDACEPAALSFAINLA